MESKRFSRREFLRAGALAAAGGALAACVPSTPEVVREEVEVTRVVETEKEVPVEVTRLVEQTPAPDTDRELWVMHWENLEYDAFNEEFTEQTGITVKNMTFPSGDWTDIMHKFALWSQTGYSGYDLGIADDLIGGMMATNGYSDDLSESFAWINTKDDVVEGVHTLNEILGGVYRIFYSMDLEPFFYYKPLVPEPPTTWDDLVAVAKEATNPDEDVWGWRPTNGAGHEFNTILLFLNQAGADLDTLDDEATLEAFTYMHDWVFTHEITPRSTVNEDNSEIINLSAQGKAGMWWNYSDAYGSSLRMEGTVLTHENSGAARFPMGPVNDNGLIHAWGWFLSSLSANKDLASEYLEWFTQPEVMKKYVMAISQSPPAYKSLLNDSDPDLVDAVPSLALDWQEILRGANFREPIVSKRPVNELWNMFQNIGKFLFSGEKSPEETQTWAVEEYRRIMEGIA
jgi:ABC-type glycerol-3-phosphate transport system substrate-binding protein